MWGAGKVRDMRHAIKKIKTMQVKSLQFFILFIGFSLTLFCPESKGQSKQDNSVSIKDNKAFYEIPAVYELIHIAFALTDTNLYTNNVNLYYHVIDTSKVYYQDVIKHFSTYRNHTLIKKLNKHLKKSQMRYIYNLLKGYNSSVSENNIRRNKRFPFFHGLMYSFTSVSRKDIEDFAKKSDFQSFYDNHRPYYQSVVDDAKNKLNVSKIQNWLEIQFDSRYDKFNIVISPLMNSTHFTRNFKFKGAKSSTMWVSDGFGYNTKLYTQTQINGIYTGVVFTEIDHNYVNPVSDNFKKEINEIMGKDNRAKWIKPKGDGYFYGTGYKVFNEYMTHAVYLIYTSTVYTEKDQTVIENSRIKLMEQMRKYYRFGDFYRQLQVLYTSKKDGETITNLYPKMLEWCKQQN